MFCVFIVIKTIENIMLIITNYKFMLGFSKLRGRFYKSKSSSFRILPLKNQPIFFEVVEFVPIVYII